VASRDSNESDTTTDENGAAAVGRLGITVAPIGDDDRAQLQLPSSQRGVLVTDVAPGGPAWNTLSDGDQGGPDIITEVEGRPVRSPADLRDAIKGMKPGDVVSLRVYNTGAKNRRVERIKLGE
jgi:S1-C subfamily serine protease